MNRFEIKFESMDHFCTLAVFWSVVDIDGETIPEWSTGSGEAMSDIEEVMVRESVGPVWMEWLGAWDFGVVCDLHRVQDLSDHDGTDHKVSICHEIPIEDRDRTMYQFHDHCHAVQVLVTVAAVGGSGLDTGCEVV